VSVFQETISELGEIAFSNHVLGRLRDRRSTPFNEKISSA
jgi:hypothetical protein